MKFKFDLNVVLAYPVYTALFITDFAVLLFLPLIRPPIILGMILVTGLVYLSMFFGVKLNVPATTADA